MDNETRPGTSVRREGDAVVNARHRITLLAETVGTRHPEYATGLNQLALLLIMQGDPASAEPLLREALEIRREALGESHPDFATNLSSLGGLLWARGALDEAEPLLRKAAEVRVATLGSNHPKTVVSLNSLEQLLHARSGAPTIPARTLPVGASTPASSVEIPDRPAVIAAAFTPTESGPPPAPPAAVAFTASDSSSPQAQSPGVDQVGQGLTTAQSLLGSLAEDFARLGDRFQEAGRGLISEGRPPVETLESHARATRARFDSLQGQLRALTGSLDVADAIPIGEDLSSLADAIPRLREAVGQRTRWVRERQEAVDLLRQVERLVCRTDPSFQPLAACRHEAAALRERIGREGLREQPEWMAPLVARKHRLADLLALVNADDSMDDGQWAVLFDQVEQSFGSSLAVAAARSRIRPTAL